MSQDYQHGYLRHAKRKSKPHCWELLWRETNEKGKLIHRTAIRGRPQSIIANLFNALRLLWSDGLSITEHLSH